MDPTLNPLTAALQQIMDARQTLGREDACAVLDHILARHEAGSPEPEARVGALLGALAARGETEDELAGFVDSLRARATRIPLTAEERSRTVDTCGTGGDMTGTFNISTAAALVAAAAGAWVAKHGNRAVTSKCGSADVLEALGIPVDHTPDTAAASLRAHGFAFLPAPALQPAMKAVMPIRRALGVRTMFNLLGPMTNPAGAEGQIIGVYAARLVPIVAETLARLNTRSAFVVHGSGMDEFSNCGPMVVAQVLDGQTQYGNLLPDAFGVPMAHIRQLAGGDAHENAAILRAIFAGETGPRRDIVLMNAAAVLVTAEIAEDFLHGMALAKGAIDSGRVSALISSLAA